MATSYIKIKASVLKKGALGKLSLHQTAKEAARAGGVERGIRFSTRFIQTRELLANNVTNSRNCDQ